MEDTPETTNPFFRQTVSSNSNSTKPLQTQDVLKAQIISTTKDGRKRLQPVSVQSPAQPKVSENLKECPADEYKGKKQVFHVLPKNIPVPTLKNLTVQTQLRNHSGVYYKLVVENFATMKGKHSQNKSIIKIMCKLNDQILWTDFYSHNILSIIGSEKYAGATFTDRSICFWTILGGRRVMPRVYLDSKTSFISIQDKYFMCVTECGYMWV
jgi:hypothetical protein